MAPDGDGSGEMPPPARCRGAIEAAREHFRRACASGTIAAVAIPSIPLTTARPQAGTHGSAARPPGGSPNGRIT
jgi:hypothetical protein